MFSLLSFLFSIENPKVRFPDTSPQEIIRKILETQNLQGFFLLPQNRVLISPRATIHVLCGTVTEGVTADNSTNIIIIIIIIIIAESDQEEKV